MWEPIRDKVAEQKGYAYLRRVSLKRIAQMIIAAPPDDDPSRCYQTDIVNGPFDVDKLDYLRRDAYFTGISLTVDIGRLLPSLAVAQFANEEREGRQESRLVVDHRGISVVEQLLFARMMLYDTVYHHHKVRAANALLQAIFRRYSKKKAWPTTSKRLDSICDLLEIDESDFFGFKYSNRELGEDIRRLRLRELPERALVITPRALIDDDSHTNWATFFHDFVDRSDPAAQKKGTQYSEKIRALTLKYAQAAGAIDIRGEDITIDIPDPPRYGKLGDKTLIEIVKGYVVPLSDLFPFQKVVNNYSEQYKYRAYVFASERYRDHVAYAAFRAFNEMGIRLNDLALILAHHHDGGQAYKRLIRAGIEPANWTEKFYAPDVPQES